MDGMANAPSPNANLSAPFGSLKNMTDREQHPNEGLESKP